MLAYYGTQLSLHMDRTPEGYLICRDVPIARTGPRSIWRGSSAGHPPENVGPENHAAYSKSHVQNVRREGKHIIADLIIPY